MQIDMGQVLTVAGTVVQGRRDFAQYVKTYTVATSVYGKNFTNVTGDYNGKRGTVKNLFTDGATIKARYVRFYVKTFYQHPSMRADILVTEGIIDGGSLCSNHCSKHSYVFHNVVSQSVSCSLTHSLTHSRFCLRQ